MNFHMSNNGTWSTTPLLQLSATAGTAYLNGNAIVTITSKGDYTTNGTNYTPFASVSTTNTSRYKDCIVILGGGGYYYGGGDTGTWLIEMRCTMATAATETTPLVPGIPSMTVRCLIPPVSTKIVSFGYYIDSEAGIAYFGIKSTGRRGEFNIITLLNNANLFTVFNGTATSTAPTGWVNITYDSITTEE